MGTFAIIATFLKRNWHFAVPVLLIVIVLVWVGIGRACKTTPKLDEKQIQRAEAAKKQQNDAALKEILAESDTRIDNIDAGLKQAEENTRKAVKNYDGMTFDELAAEIERRKTQ